LSASLEALTKERERMQKELAAAATKITTLEKVVETKTSEIERLSKD
jgi:prefoldin subunit 5